MSKRKTWGTGKTLAEDAQQLRELRDSETAEEHERALIEAEAEHEIAESRRKARKRRKAA